MAENENEDLVPRDQIEPTVMDEGEQEHPPVQEILVVVARVGHKELENQLFLTITKFIIAKKYKMRLIPPLLKKP